MASTDNAAPAITQATTAGPDDAGKKVFVGNLAFSTTSDELKELFGSVGAINDAQIITRNTRSLGYGFVTYESVDSATAAISKFDKHTLGERTINVEIAKPDRADKVSKAAAKAAGVTEPAAEGEGQGRPRRARKPRKPRADGEADGETAGAVAAGADGEAGTGAPRKRTAKSRAKKAVNAVTDAVSNVAGGGVGTANKRGPRPKATQGPPSENKLFVANLPFSLDNAGLGKLFTDNGFEVVQARIATRRVYPKAPKVEGEQQQEGVKKERPAPFTKSRGFGFVTLKGKEDLDRALTVVEGKEIGEGEEKRIVQLKVANERIYEEEGAEGQEGAEVAA